MSDGGDEERRRRRSRECDVIRCCDGVDPLEEGRDRT
jgi:hypothetical protein